MNELQYSWVVFENVGVDYAGPVYIKYSFVRKLTGLYLCLRFVVGQRHLSGIGVGPDD